MLFTVAFIWGQRHHTPSNNWLVTVMHAVIELNDQQRVIMMHDPVLESVNYLVEFG